VNAEAAVAEAAVEVSAATAPTEATAPREETAPREANAPREVATALREVHAPREVKEAIETLPEAVAAQEAAVEEVAPAPRVVRHQLPLSDLKQKDFLQYR
jgi:hypothetical protein